MRILSSKYTPSSSHREVTAESVCCDVWVYTCLGLCIVSTQCIDTLHSSSCRCQHLCTLPVQRIWHSTKRLHKVWGLLYSSYSSNILVFFSNLPSFVSVSFCPFCLHQDFVAALSILLRGSITEKLQWTFNLYDVNRDGYINKEVCVLCICKCLTFILFFQLCLFAHCLCIFMLISHLPSHLCVCFVGDDRHRQSDIRHDGEVHLPCLEKWCTQTACGGLLSGNNIWVLYLSLIKTPTTEEKMGS